MIFDDVNLLATQLANDGLHTHALHSHAGADRIHLFVFRHDSNFRALASFAGNRADHDRTVVNFRNFSLKQVLNEFRHRARHYNAGPLRGLFDARNHDSHALADGE